MFGQEQFKNYRKKLGFPNQDGLKKFLAAKDLLPSVDFDYIDKLNMRLKAIISKINTVVPLKLRKKDLDGFYKKFIDSVFNALNEQSIIPRMNNQGRRPEEVYFSWMRGFVLGNYFLDSVALGFEIDTRNITSIGDDDFTDLSTFRRTPKADYQLKLDNDSIIRIEMQTGYVGINDIKQHKVLEAKRLFHESKVKSFVIHFDLFNGQVAVVSIESIADTDVNWITRQQMEGQTVFNIDQNKFIWNLVDEPPVFKNFVKI